MRFSKLATGFFKTAIARLQGRRATKTYWRSRRLLFEALEPRILLSSAPTIPAMPLPAAYGPMPPALVGAATVGSSIAPSSTAAPSSITAMASSQAPGSPIVIASLPSGSYGDNLDYSNLNLDRAGNLYGTSWAGGAYGDGAVYEIAKGSGTATTLASFNGADGKNPAGNLVVDSNGDVFGTTRSGGANNVGAVFEVAHGTGTITLLGSCGGSNNIGTVPVGGLVADSTGNLYGVTSSGGGYGSGTIFSVPEGGGQLTALASFDGFTTGSEPNGLTIDSAGNLYGTTYGGGAYRAGAVFELPHGSNTISVLASFNGTTTASPAAGVTLDGSGDIFGTTIGGGGNGGNDGTIFEVVKGSGAITVLASFNGTNGSAPFGPVTLGLNGNIYGVTDGGGPSTDGTVYELLAGIGSITDLAALGTNTFGPPQPYGAVVFDGSGNLYGTTAAGGANGGGVVFEVPNATSLLSPPTMSMATPSGKQEGDVTISYTLTSDGSDICSILPQYSTNGGTTWETAVGGSGGDGTSGLASSPTGTSHTFVWASGQTGTDLANVSDSAVEFRITPISANGQGAAVTTGPFMVDDVVPRVSVATPAGTQNGNITITYTLTDAHSDPLNLVGPTYSTDGGQTWHQASSAGGDGNTNLTSSPGGATHTFIWASGTDLPNVNAGVLFSIGAVEAPGNPGTVEGAGQTTSFTVDNGPLVRAVQVVSSGSGSYSVTISGTGFGTAPVASGYLGDTAYLQITDAATSGNVQWGYTGDANQLTYQSWTNSQVVLTGFRAAPGDAVTLEVWNPSTGMGGNWSGNTPLAPSITTITTHGVPGTNNWGFIIQGTNLGSQTAFDGVGAYLNLVDASVGLSAGYTGDSITANVVSWTNISIEIANLGGTYGQGTNLIQALDELKLVLMNPQTDMISNTKNFTLSNTAQSNGGYLGLQVSGSQTTNAAILQNGNTVTFMPSGADETQYVSTQSIQQYMGAGDNVTLKTLAGTGTGAPDITIGSGAYIDITPLLPLSLSFDAGGNINMPSGGIINLGYPPSHLTPPSPIPVDITMVAGDGGTAGASISINADIRTGGGNLTISALGGTISIGTTADNPSMQTGGGSLTVEGNTVNVSAGGLDTDAVPGFYANALPGGSILLYGASSLTLKDAMQIQTSGSSDGTGEPGGGGGSIIIASGGELSIGSGTIISSSSSYSGGGGAILIAETSASGEITFGSSNAGGISTGGGALEVYSTGTISNWGEVRYTTTGSSAAGGSVAIQSDGTALAQGGAGAASGPTGAAAVLDAIIPGIKGLSGGGAGQSGGEYEYAENEPASSQPTISNVAVTQTLVSPPDWSFTATGQNFGTLPSTWAQTYITLTDTTRGYTFADSISGDGPLYLGPWANSQIVINGYQGVTSTPIEPGDRLTLTVVNPQSGEASTPYSFYASESAMPSASVATPSGTQSGTVTINYTLTDATSSTCSIAAQFSTDGGANWWGATPASGWSETYGLSSSPTGVAHSFLWDSSTDVNGPPANNVEFRITPSSGGLTGQPAATTMFTVDNAGSPVPSAAIATPSGIQSGSIAIDYTLTDASSETCNIAAQYSADGGTNWDTATAGNGGDGTSGLSSSASGTAHEFVWNSAADLAGVSSSDVEFRIVPSATSGTGSAAATSPFTVQNGRPVTSSTAPQITNVSVTPSAGSPGNWSLTISGSNFGTQNAFSTANTYLSILDTTDNVPAGGTGETVTATVTSWTASQIVIQSFGGDYGQPGLVIDAGDTLSIKVTNPQTNQQGTAAAAVPSSPSAVPTISSASFQPNNGNWTVTIVGSDFGSQPSFISQTSPYLEIADQTTGLDAGHSGDPATLTVSSWTNSSIVVSGFGGSNYGVGTSVINPGDRISVTVWNPQTNAQSTAFATATPSGPGSPAATDTKVTVDTTFNGSDWTVGFSSGKFSSSFTIDPSLLDGILQAVQTAQQIENVIGDIPGFHVETSVNTTPSYSVDISGDMYFSPTGTLDQASLTTGLSLGGISATIEGYLGLSFLNVGLGASLGFSAGLNASVNDLNGAITMGGTGNLSGTLTAFAEATAALWQGEASISGTLGAKVALASDGIASLGLSLSGSVGLGVNQLPLFSSGPGTTIWSDSYDLGSLNLGQWNFNIEPFIQSIINDATGAFDSFLGTSAQTTSSSIQPGLPVSANVPDPFQAATPNSVATSTAPTQTTYSIQGLGIPSGAASSEAAAINGSGQVAGDATVGSGATASTEGLLFSNGGYFIIPGPGGSRWAAAATAINSGGYVTGSGATPGGQADAFLYAGGSTASLGSLSGPLGTPFSAGTGIDTAGDVVGYSGTNADTTNAFLYSATTKSMADLGTLGGTSSAAFGISPNGDYIVGYSATAENQTHAFVWTSGGVSGLPGNPQMQDLGTLGGTTSFAMAVNNSGDVVGYSTPSSGTDNHAFYYDGTFHDLGDPNGFGAYADAVNSSGTVVGYYYTSASATTAFIAVDGTLVPLNSLLPSNSGWNLEAATGINDSGDIVGYGINPTGQTEAFELTPTGAPLLVSAASEKTQGGAGTFGINLPLTGTPGVEDRINGPTQLVLTFQNPIRKGANFSVTPSETSVNVISTTVSGDTLTINLSGATQGQTLTVTANDVQDATTGASGNYSLSVAALYGDVNSNGLVNVADINIVRQASGNTVNSTDFRDDLNCNGLINVADINIVRQLSGATLSASTAASTLSAATIQTAAAPLAVATQNTPAAADTVAVPPTASAVTTSNSPVSVSSPAAATPTVTSSSGAVTNLAAAASIAATNSTTTVAANTGSGTLASQGDASGTSAAQASAGGTPPVQPPAISSVALSPLAGSTNNWQFIITGTGFGSQNPFNGDSTDLKILDPGVLSAGSADDAVTAHVSEWTNDEIVISGLTGAYGLNGWVIAPGNNVLFEITNPQTGVISKVFSDIAA